MGSLSGPTFHISTNVFVRHQQRGWELERILIASVHYQNLKQAAEKKSFILGHLAREYSDFVYGLNHQICGRYLLIYSGEMEIVPCSNPFHWLFIDLNLKVYQLLRNKSIAEAWNVKWEEWIAEKTAKIRDFPCKIGI